MALAPQQPERGVPADDRLRDCTANGRRVYSRLQTARWITCQVQAADFFFLVSSPVCFFGARIWNHVRHTTCKWRANFCVLCSGCLLHGPGTNGELIGSLTAKALMLSSGKNWEIFKEVQRWVAPSGDGVGGHRYPSDGCGPNFLPYRKTRLCACCCGARSHGTKGGKRMFHSFDLSVLGSDFSAS